MVLCCLPCIWWPTQFLLVVFCFFFWGARFQSAMITKGSLMIRVSSPIWSSRCVCYSVSVLCGKYADTSRMYLPLVLRIFAVHLLSWTGSDLWCFSAGPIPDATILVLVATQVPPTVPVLFLHDLLAGLATILYFVFPRF